MKRSYTMRKRADEQHRTRERILQATMQLHDEKGVAPTTMSDIAKRARIGQATLYRHFPTIGDLVQTCGGHVWQELRPPMPDQAAAVFAGAEGRQDRLERLFQEIDAFYARGKLRLGLSLRDRDLVPQLDGFWKAVEAGIGALLSEAIAPLGLPERATKVIAVLTSFPVWSQFETLDLPEPELRRLKLRLAECAIRAEEQ